ncbi:MAG TPA: OmpH family outer membrane protein [Lutibacter sp.]|nr:OmpH family outer membrane protein [Lutibacter sp.]
MKKIILLLIAIVTLSSCTQQKIGYVNSSDLMKDYKAVKDLESEIKDKQNLLQGKYEQVALAFEKEVQEFQLKSKKQSRKKGEARYQELMYKQQQIQQSQQQESVALQKESQDQMDDLIDDMKDLVKDYAKDNGYTYILGTNESGNVLYGAKEYDLTETLLDVINADYKNGKSAVSDEVKETVKDSIK